MRQRGRRLEREQDRREPQTVGEQVPDVGEQELHSIADDRSERDQSVAAQDMMDIIFRRSLLQSQY